MPQPEQQGPELLLVGGPEVLLVAGLELGLVPELMLARLARGLRHHCPRY